MESRPKTPSKILMVEDDPAFVYNLSLRLKKDPSFPIEVISASALHGAMEMLAKDTFDLVLLDLSLPDSQGMKTYANVAGAAKTIPIVILSGLNNDEMALEAVRQGAEDYLVKGEVEGKMIARVIHYAIERHRVKTELSLTTRKLREINLQLEKMTILDPLTALYNRRGLQQALSREIKWAARHGWRLLAIILDIDHFKQLNDALGYAVGDVLLRELSNIFRKSVRLTDHIGRIGGDEFVLLLPETPFEEGVKIAERLRLMIADTVFMLSEKKMNNKMTASLGLMTVPQDTVSVDALLAKIHPLLKKSKMLGRNRLTYEENVTGLGAWCGLGSPHHLAMLRDASAFRSLRQGIYDLRTREIVGYEFLSRFRHENFQAPDVFFRIAIENNMLTLVDHHCYMACAIASEQVSGELRSHINLFPSTIIDVPAHNIIESLPDKRPLANYCIEISEQQIMGDPSYLVGAVEEIKRAGVKIAIDDVGFGHSCLESLVVFEPDIVKIDRKCVSLAFECEKKTGYLRKLLKIAESIGAEVVAEGIESEKELDLLRDLGVRYGQGYLLGKPS